MYNNVYYNKIDKYKNCYSWTSLELFVGVDWKVLKLGGLGSPTFHLMKDTTNKLLWAPHLNRPIVESYKLLFLSILVLS